MLFRTERVIIGSMWYRFVSTLLLASSFLFAQTAEQDSRSALNRGVAAFKSAKYADAASEFELATRLDPGNIAARLYLGTAYMTQWIPGPDTPANEEFATRAEAAFRAALEIDPRDKTAIMSLASIAFNKGRSSPNTAVSRLGYLDEAEAWYRKLTEIDSSDKIPFYSLGVIAWLRFYPELMDSRGRFGMKPQDPGPLPDFNVRADLRSRLGRTVEEGMASLNRAIAIDPLYDDAMAYLNLLYRERADLSESAEDYKRDVATADDWVTKALDARKRKGESGNSYGAVVPPPPPQLATSSERIRIGGNIQAANLIQKPAPVYPPLAKQARVQGTVRFTVIIDKQGATQNIQLVSGHPLLVPSAVEAVKQYTYKPTLLNGQPVEVITQVDVNFTLSN